MSAALHLATPEDLDRIEPMVTAFHAHRGIRSDETRRRKALGPLLEGSPLGAVYIIGPRRSPIGYIVVTFGWSLEFGGMDGFIDEFYIREGVRGRGVGTEVLAALLPRLEAAGLRALHIEVDAENPRLERFYARNRFHLRDGHHLMTRSANAA